MDTARPVQATPRRMWLWQPNLIVFVSSACIMILELVAGRIIAPHVGSSLYTWTSVIGVVLAGISLGNYVGGKIADRWASLRILGAIYILAALTSLLTLWVDRTNRITPDSWGLVLEILVLTTALFFLPCAILGTISPIVAKLAVSDLAKTGSTVGKIYAAGALGSIVGTFATGFVLISWFGTYTIIWGVALLLATMGLVFILAARWLSFLLAVVVIVGGSARAQNQGWLSSQCARETDYYCIKIMNEDRDGESIRLLVLDRLVNSYVSLNNPKALIYDYEKVYADAAAYQADTKDPLRALMIGGGGYTFPRYLQVVYPSSEVDVVEIDPGVTQVAFDELALPRDTNIVTHNEDARMYLARTPSARYDLILGDAFNHYSVPYHLTTKEFNDQVQKWLAPGGIYVMNLIDGPNGEFVRAYMNTLRQTFRYVYLTPGGDGWKKTIRTTFVLLATDTALDKGRLVDLTSDVGGMTLANRLASPEEVDRLLTEAPTVVLTDQYAPVDQMLAAVFREEGPKQ